jgi:hypothetical protein
MARKLEKSEDSGVKRHLPDLDSALKDNQRSIVDDLLVPHSTRLDEIIGPAHRIVASYPAHTAEAQHTQARGRIVWNRSFQPHGPSYLDPVPDPGPGGGY